MSSLNLSRKKREPSRGSLKIDEEKSIFGKIYSSMRDKDKKSIDPTPSVMKLEEMLAQEKEHEKEQEKEKEKKRDIFGKMHSLREKKKSVDLTSSIHKLEDMLAKEKEKDNEKEKEKAKRKKNDNPQDFSLNASALKQLDAMNNRAEQQQHQQRSTSPSSASAAPNSPDLNPRVLHRKDTLLSLQTYHTKRKSPLKNKETSSKELPMKRDMSVMELESMQKLSSSKRGDSVATRGRRAMSSPKRAEDRRKQMEQLTRFEHSRKVNIDRIQSKLSIPTAPVIVSSRLPSTLLPPLTMSRPTKRKKEANSDSRPISPSLMLRSPPLSPRLEKQSPSSRTLVSSSPVKTKNNSSIMLKRDTSADGVLKTSSNKAEISKPPNTDVKINCSVIISTDNTTDILISPSTTPDSKWFTGFSLSSEVNNSTDFTHNKQKAFSYDERSPLSRDVSVASHRLTKDDIDI